VVELYGFRHINRVSGMLACRCTDADVVALGVGFAEMRAGLPPGGVPGN